MINPGQTTDLSGRRIRIGDKVDVFDGSAKSKRGVITDITWARFSGTYISIETEDGGKHRTRRQFVSKVKV